jgi:hypothetical protein
MNDVASRSAALRLATPLSAMDDVPPEPLKAIARPAVVECCSGQDSSKKGAR